MTKSKRIFYGLASTMAVVAPVAAVVSCGSSKSTSKTTPTNPTPDLPSGQKPGYTYQIFKDNTKKYNDNARWAGGISYQPLLAIASLFRAIAEKYGYSTPDDSGVSQREKDLTVRDGDGKVVKTRVYVRADGTIFGTPTLDQQHVINTLKTFKQDTQTVAQNSGYTGYSAVGDDFEIDVDRLNQLNIKSNLKLTASGNDKKSIAVDTNNDSNLVPFIRLDWYVTFDDTETQGLTRLILHEQNWDVSYEINLVGLRDKYPKIKASDFDVDFLPTIKLALQKFIDLYNGLGASKSLAEQVIKDPSLLGEINFLISKVTKNGHLNVDNDATFNGYLHELSEGGYVHLEPIKALYSGYDASMATGLIAPFSVVGKTWAYKASLEGLAQMESLFGIQDWSHYNYFNKYQDDNAPKAIPDDSNLSKFKGTRIDYVATQTDEENLLANGYTQADINNLKEYIDYLDAKK